MANSKGLRFIACLTVVIPVFISGCAMVGPDYTKLRPEAGKNWEASMDKGLETSRPEKEKLSRWWRVLNDPVLSKLEKKAVEGNLDLKTAFSRLRQARLSRGISRSVLYPALDADGRAQRQQSSESMPTGSGEEHDYYISRFDSSWELDVFGGIRRSVQAARAELEASRANADDVLTSLTAEVALNYIEVRTYQHRLDITRENIKIQKKTYEMNKSRYQAGLIDELAVHQALRNLERTRSTVSRLESGLRAAKNRMAVLLGLEPGLVDAELIPSRPIPQVPAKVAVGIPAEAMRRRPDIRMAERQVAAQTARIGAATAELYPSFHLFGTIGLESLDSGDFLDAQSEFWSIGPGVSWNIFRGRALRLNIELQTEKQKEAVINYKSAVLQAREEIEDALTRYAKEQIREESLQKAVSAAKRTEFLARDRFKAGLADFYNVMDAQRSLLDLEDELIQSRGQVASNLAGLYKALGGGWQYQDKTVKEAENAVNGKETQGN
ncbi:MAG: efflux transporter outer membrane subunit [Desulfosalsimonadaceae bacterium]